MKKWWESKNRISGKGGIATIVILQQVKRKHKEEVKLSYPRYCHAGL